MGQAVENSYVIWNAVLSHKLQNVFGFGFMQIRRVHYFQRLEALFLQIELLELSYSVFGFGVLIDFS